jgi:hypothetical protein
VFLFAPSVRNFRTIPVVYTGTLLEEETHERSVVIVKSVALLMASETITIHPHCLSKDSNEVMPIPVTNTPQVLSRRSKSMTEMTRMM